MIVETVKTVQMHLARATATRRELFCFLDALSAEDFINQERVKVIDAFLFRFIKIQDLMGNKLFREVLDRIGEYDDSMSMLDVLDRMEKLELIESADAWMDYRNLRNVLTHEYPDNKDVVIQGIKMAVQVFVTMERCFRDIVSYLDARSLSG
jgi:hypothetical protein